VWGAVIRQRKAYCIPPTSTDHSLCVCVCVCAVCVLIASEWLDRICRSKESKETDSTPAAKRERGRLVSLMYVSIVSGVPEYQLDDVWFRVHAV
jgi:hypothetical protein